MALTAEEKRKRKVEKMALRLRALSPGKQINDVAAAFQKLVKLQNADEFGMCSCFTCDTRYSLLDKRMNAGHFVSRSHRVTVFDFRNCHPQCAHCNRHLSGNLGVYHDQMVKKYGHDVVTQLLAAKQQSKAWSVEELSEMKIDFMESIRLISKARK